MTTTLAPPLMQPGQRALHILVVEDNLDSQQLVCELLQMLGHDAAGADSAELALQALEQQRFDVLFTDISLPGMSGIELARQSSLTYPALKIIFASGYGAQISKNVASEAFLLPKPYDIDQLQQILDSIRQQLSATG
jgi:CheY-like chemotaxis protein